MSKNRRILGRKPILDALLANETLEVVYIANHVQGELEKEVRKLCKEASIPLKRVHKDHFKKYGQQNHQYLEAYISPVRFWTLDEIIPSIYEKGQAPLLLWLDKLQDVRNFGAIARSALAFGVHAILIPIKNAAAINEIAIKTSAGALLKMPLIRYTKQGDVARELANNGIKLHGAELVASTTLRNIDWKEPSCLVIGSEEKGINRELLELCDERFVIPQSKEIESLNASVAASISLYEAAAQRNQ